MTLHGNPGIIADFLASAGERVEQGALAGVGAAGDSNERKGVHRIGWT
jgi:hypothetical protein